jgi:hypothetical protein
VSAISIWVKPSKRVYFWGAPRMEMQDILYIIYNVGTQFASIAPANPPQVREHSKKTLGQSYWSNLISLRDCA